MTQKKIAVIGAGSWGTALSLVLADNGHAVDLWTHKLEHAQEMSIGRSNDKYLPGVFLPDNISIHSELSQVISNNKIIVLVTPSHALMDLLPEMRKFITDNITIIHAIKGINPDTLQRVSEIIFSKIPEISPKQVAVLSGPSHAEEVAARKPTTVVVAAENIETANLAQDIFINDRFRVYTNNDMLGVELGGALKNIIAIGAGISDGLGFGDNAKAALVTRGLAEITRLGVFLGAKPRTFAGLAGIGDLIVTSTSIHSRNYRAGKMLGEGKSLQETLKDMKMVVEGVKTTQAAYKIAKQNNINMPIANELYNILFENKNVKEAVVDLMTRDKKEELFT